MDQTKKPGVAIVGLGTYTVNEILPAFAETSHCKLAGLVGGNAAKNTELKTRFNLPEKNIYTYEQFDTIADNSEIDIVYVILPNSMHAEYVIRAAKAGKHVICEKPMATSVEDCRKMLDACSQAGVKLSVGYRLHYDPFNLEMMRLGQNEVLGPIKKVIARNGMDVGKPDQWRLRKNLAGGGALMDVGIYCLQAAIYTIGNLPIAVSARYADKTDPDRFKEVEEGITWEMEFPGGVTAFCETSYSKEMNILRAETDSGWFELQPAFEYRGIQGNTSVGPMDFGKVYQQAKQIDDFAECVLHNRDSKIPGEMGMRDVEILLAIYQAAETGKRVELQLQPYETLVEM